ncbi:MAG: AAA family ATPase, partial [Vicinamibacterales bacterium]
MSAPLEAASNLVAMPARPASIQTPPPLRPHQAPFSNNAGERYLPPSLNRRVRRFLAKHMIPALINKGQARYLLVFGAAGVGKTLGVLMSASEFGWGVLVISAAEFSGDTEGAAQRAWRAALSDASAISHRNGYPVAVLVDDFDLSIAGPDDQHTERTINSNLLMHDIQWLADQPDLFTTCRGAPVPVNFTGNDSHFRPSLFRDGRADRFTYEPEPEEKVHIIERLFSPATTTETWTVHALARRYRDRPVSFFVALKSDIEAAQLDSVLDGDLTDTAAIEALLAKPARLDARLLNRLAKARAAEEGRNHLCLGLKPRVETRISVAPVPRVLVRTAMVGELIKTLGGSSSDVDVLQKAVALGVLRAVNVYGVDDNGAQRENVELEFDGRPAAKSDDIADTVNYKTICKRIVSLTEGNRFN